MTEPQTIWHYTKMDFLGDILDSGALLPKAETETDCARAALKMGMHLSTSPLIWFSSNQYWEASCVQLSAGLNRHGMTWQDLAYEQEAIRFGILNTDSRLLDWNATCIANSANRTDRRRMDKLAIKARKAGSDASKWFTSPVPIPLDDLILQRWIRGRWREY